MISILVVGATYIDLDQYKIENNLYSKTNHYTKEGIAEYTFISTSDPNLSHKIRGVIFNELVLLDNVTLTGRTKNEILSRVMPE